MIKPHGKYGFLVLVIILSFWHYAVYSQSQTFTSSGTFAVPPGVTSIIVECWGGGGAGGGTTNNGVNSGGGGGAGGAYARKSISVAPGTTYTVTVGGVAAGSQGPGANGNPSWFGDVSTVYAEGGAGGAAPSGGTSPGGIGSASGSIGDFVFPGGNGADGNTTISGGGGGAAGSTGPGGNGSGTTGGTGTPLFGGDGGTGLSAQGNGNPGSNYGGGGSGAYVPKNKNQAGGNGDQGLVVISWSFVVYTTSGTFTVPEGVSSVSVECWGGGGAGGGSTSGTYAAGGGGGGAYSFSVVNVVPGTTYTVTVGQGGTGTTGNGTSGGDTWFSTTGTILASGGQGGLSPAGSDGNGGTGGDAASGIGTVRYSGGNGADGGAVNKRGGGGGSSAGTASNGTAASGTSGGIAPSGGGNGGNGGASNTNGSPGSSPGGAGGGSGTSATGGSGAGGQVIITWVPPVYYSQVSGDPNDLSNWKTASGYSPTNFSAASQTFKIQNGHTMTTTASGWSVSGGNTVVEVMNGGILTETYPVTISSNTLLNIANGAVFNHNVNSLSVFGGIEYFGSSSTTIYGYDGSQTISEAVYGNIILAVSGTKSYTSFTVYGILSLEGTVVASSAGSPNFGPSASLRYKGSDAQFTGPEFPVSLSSSGGLIIDNSNGVTLTSSKTVEGPLTLTSGILTTGSFVLTLGTTSSVTGAGDGKYIYGNLAKAIGASSVTKIFEIGDASFYTPAEITFTGITNGTGSILAYTTPGDHPDIGTSSINAASTVNRYWTLINNGVTGFTSYDITLTFNAADLDVSTDYTSFIVGNYSAAAWSYPTPGTRSVSSTNATGLVTFGDYQIGNIYLAFRSAASGDWDQPGTWEVSTGGPWSPASSTPNSVSGPVTLRSPYIINITSSLLIDEVTLDAGATLILTSGATLADGSGTDMTVSGIIDCVNPLTGAGSFELMAGGKIIIRSAEGITASGSSGSIQTASRIFNTLSDYSYNGSAIQVTGDALPGSVNNLTIDNSQGVTLTSSITLNGTLSLAAGSLSAAANHITFQTSDTPIIRTSGTLTLSVTTDLAFGTPGSEGGAPFAIPSGTFTSAPVINSLTINRTSQLTLNDQLLSVTGTVLCNGPLNTNNNLLLSSGASGTAYISGAGTGQITGNVTMQRYLPSGFGYKYFSSPFQDATVNELSDDINLASSFTTFYRYDENRLVGGVPASGWVSYKTTTNPLVPLAGYAVNFGSVSDPATFDVTGSVNNGNLSVTLYNNDQIYTKGFNLVGNPYPSAIDWDLAGWTRTNIDDAIYFFRASAADQYGGTYSSYVNGIPSDGFASPVIASMQGFFVHVTDGAYPVTGTLGVSNSVRTENLTRPYLKSGSKGPSQLVRIAAEFTDDANSLDPVVLCFGNDATENFDSKYDALKIFNTDLKIPNLYTPVAGDKRLSISMLPEMTASSLQIPLGLKINRAGIVRFSVMDIDVTTSALGVSLYDAATGVSHNLLEGNFYEVTLPRAEYLNRFYLNIGSVATGIREAVHGGLSFGIYSRSGPVVAEISGITGSRASLVIYNLLGQPVFRKELYDDGRYEFTQEIPEGVYIAMLMSGNSRISRKLYIIGK